MYQIVPEIGFSNYIGVHWIFTTVPCDWFDPDGWVFWVFTTVS